MFLQTKMTNRRGFLERSALGAGSILFAPLLLESCTDHNIPPSGPIKPPIVGDDDSTDWNEDTKNAVATFLQLVPDVGGFLGSLVSIFWGGSGTSPWDQIKDQVEELIDQKIAVDVYNRVTAQLSGLNQALSDYTSVANSTDLNAVQAQWIAARTTVDAAQGAFQQTGDEVLLLPLFAQYANMNLALYKAGTAFGKSWGWDDTFWTAVRDQLQKNITDFTNYAKNTYNSGRSNVVNNTAESDRDAEPFTSVNKYDRQMTLLVLDYMDTWPYYNIVPDPSDSSRKAYPNGAKNPDGTPIYLFTREVYSDPYGNTWKPDTGNTGNPIVLPSPATQFPTQITVWAGSRIDAVQLTYPTGGGPGGVTTTPRMGDSNGGSANNFNISPDLPIIRAVVSYSNAQTQPLDQVVNTLLFIFSNGNGNTLSPQMGAKQGQFQSGNVGPDGYALSSIYIHGTNSTYGNSADCIVFGFMRWPRR